MPKNNLDAISDIELVDELASDLDWLRERSHHCISGNPQLVMRVQMSSSLVRNIIGPFLRNCVPPLIHVTVVGGAGTGKSTVVNFILGKPLAESNPQAGFTRHPVAYMPEDGQADWPTTPGFLAPLHLLPGNRPANLDENVYQIRRFVPVLGDDLLRHAVVWDCPDVTTWHSVTYLPRVLEVVSLADAVVFVASDERYNDEVPTQLLRLILQSGKPVVCVLTKMREADVEPLLKHFRQDVVDRMPNADRVAACVAVPFLDPRILADPVGQGRRWREPLLNALRNCFSHPLQARTTTVRGAVQFMQESTKDLVAAVSEDLAALNTWKELVEQGRREFESRYFREYLELKSFPGLDRYRKLLDQVDLPIYKWFRSWIPFASRGGNAQTRPETEDKLPERDILQSSLDSWLNRLQVEMTQQSRKSLLFDRLAQWIGGSGRNEAKDCLECGYQEYVRLSGRKEEELLRLAYPDIDKYKNDLTMVHYIIWGFAIVLGIPCSIVLGYTIHGGLLVIVFLAVLLVGAWLWDLSQIRKKVEFFYAKWSGAARQELGKLMSGTIAQPIKELLINWPIINIPEFSRLEHIENRLGDCIGRVYSVVTRRLGGYDK